MSANPKPPIATDDHALAARIARIGEMPPRELLEAYRHTFGRETSSGNRAWPVRANSNRLRAIEQSHQRPRGPAIAEAVAKDFGCEAGFARRLRTSAEVVEPSMSRTETVVKPFMTDRK